MYIMIGCVGYYRLGSDFDKSKPVTSVLPQDIWTSLANVGLLAHCIIAYMVGSATPALQRYLLLLKPFPYDIARNKASKRPATRQHA